MSVFNDEIIYWVQPESLFEVYGGEVKPVLALAVVEQIVIFINTMHKSVNFIPVKVAKHEIPWRFLGIHIVEVLVHI